MRFRLRITVIASALALGSVLIAPPSARAQCGGGCGHAWGGHSVRYNSGSPRGAGAMGCMGMSMGGMAMNGMGSTMDEMPMGGPTPQAAIPKAPAAKASALPAAATYYCPMHPGVMSTFAAKCPECGMALKKR